MTLIPLALVIAAFAWLIAWSIKRGASKYPPAAPELHSRSGVGGWLLFLVFGLMMGPFVGLAQCFEALRGMEELHPQLKQMAQWSNYTRIVWITVWLYTVLSFFAGYGLYRFRNRRAVRRAQIILWIIGPIMA